MIASHTAVQAEPSPPTEEYISIGPRREECGGARVSRSFRAAGNNENAGTYVRSAQIAIRIQLQSRRRGSVAYRPRS